MITGHLSHMAGLSKKCIAIKQWGSISSPTPVGLDRDFNCLQIISPNISEAVRLLRMLDAPQEKNIIVVYVNLF